LASAPTQQSNIAELQAIWRDYQDVVIRQFPEIRVDRDNQTISRGELSPGCTLCKNGQWDCLFVTPECNLNCEFCISTFAKNPRVPLSALGRDKWQITKNYQRVHIRGISLSGGEPLCNFNRTVDLLTFFKSQFPENYFWLYTNGVRLTERQIDALSDLALDEIRFNTAATGLIDMRVLKIMEYAAKRIRNITVEIPLLLKDKAMLLNAIPAYENAGVNFLNGHELMKERHSPSENLSDERFKKIIFEDGHITEISLDSAIVVNDILTHLMDAGSRLNFNFCSTMNKRMQVKKRRQNIIALLKQPFEKIVDDEFLETCLVYNDSGRTDFIHPDEWHRRQMAHEDIHGLTVKTLAPVSIFKKGAIVAVTPM